MIFICLVSSYCLKICFTFNFFASKETNHGEVQESFYHYIFVRFFVVCGIFYQYFNIFCMWFRFCFVIVCGIFCMRYCLNKNSEPRQFLVAHVWSRGAGCLGWKSMCANEDINLQPHGATKGGQGLVRVECKDESRHRVKKWLFCYCLVW